MASKYTLYKLGGTISAAGTIEAYSNSVARGKIETVLIDRPAGNVAVKLSTEGVVSEEFVDLATGNTDVAIYPRRQVTDKANTDLNLSNDGTAVTKLVEKYAVFGRLKLECSAGTAGQSVSVGVIVEEY